MITEWFDWIWEYGLVRGECDYYIAKKDSRCAVYYKDGQKVSEDYISAWYMEDVGNVIFNENLGIVEIKKYSGETQTIEFNPVIRKKEEFLDYTKLLNI
jgi:hypothetical protein